MSLKTKKSDVRRAYLIELPHRPLELQRGYIPEGCIEYIDGPAAWQLPFAMRLHGYRLLYDTQRGDEVYFAYLCEWAASTIDAVAALRQICDLAGAVTIGELGVTLQADNVNLVTQAMLAVDDMQRKRRWRLFRTGVARVEWAGREVPVDVLVREVGPRLLDRLARGESLDSAIVELQPAAAAALGRRYRKGRTYLSRRKAMEILSQMWREAHAILSNAASAPSPQQAALPPAENGVLARSPGAQDSTSQGQPSS